MLLDVAQAVPDHFWCDLFSNTYRSFLASWSATTLSLCFQVLGGFIFTEILTFAVVGFRQGRGAMTNRVESFKIGLIVFVVLSSVYPITFAYQFWWHWHKINTEAFNQVAPVFTRNPPPPDWALGFSDANLFIEFSALNSFPLEFTSDTIFSFAGKREYIMEVSNKSKNPVKSLDILIQFPFPAESTRLLKSTGAEGLEFLPTFQLAANGGGSIQIRGCVGIPAFTLTARELRPDGFIKIAFILNSTRSEFKENLKDQYIDAKFLYQEGPSWTKKTRYGSLMATEKNVVVYRIENRPSSFTEIKGYVMLTGPCIPSSSLRDPDK